MNILEKIATEAGSRFIENRMRIVNENRVPTSSNQQPVTNESKDKKSYEQEGNARHWVNNRKKIVADSKMMGDLRNIIHNSNSMNLNSVKGDGTFRITGRNL